MKKGAARHHQLVWCWDDGGGSGWLRRALWRFLYVRRAPAIVAASCEALDLLRTLEDPFLVMAEHATEREQRRSNRLGIGCNTPFLSLSLSLSAALTSSRTMSFEVSICAQHNPSLSFSFQLNGGAPSPSRDDPFDTQSQLDLPMSTVQSLLPQTEHQCAQTSSSTLGT